MTDKEKQFDLEEGLQDTRFVESSDDGRHTSASAFCLVAPVRKRKTSDFLWTRITTYALFSSYIPNDGHQNDSQKYESLFERCKTIISYKHVRGCAHDRVLKTINIIESGNGSYSEETLKARRSTYQKFRNEEALSIVLDCIEMFKVA